MDRSHSGLSGEMKMSGIEEFNSPRRLFLLWREITGEDLRENTSKKHTAKCEEPPAVR